MRNLRLLLMVATIAPLALAAQARGGAPLLDTVPTDLRPLLVAHQSELRLVALRYTQDRALLSSNYAGNVQGGRGGRGGPVVDTAAKPFPISWARIQRLYLFDRSWDSALVTVNRADLSPQAQPDLDTLRSTVAANEKRFEDDGASLVNGLRATGTIVGPLVLMFERRLRLATVNPEESAHTLSNALAEIHRVRAQLESTEGLRPASREDATRVGASLEMVRNDLGEWFRFYNGYDPLFTWWMGVPHQRLDSALHGLTLYVRDTLIADGNGARALAPTYLEGRTFSDVPSWRDAIMDTKPNTYALDGSRAQALTDTRGKPVAAPLPDVPSLAEILHLPQDEMTEIVRQFVPRGGNGGGRGNAPPQPAQTRDSAFYARWLTALNSLDFDKLSRNAQVDYLYIRTASQNELARSGHPLQPNPPRVADKSGIPGAARGRDGLIRDLQDEFIPYTPEQLEVLAEREFAITEKEMIKASRAMGFGDDWKKAVEKVKTEHVPPGGQPAFVRDLIYQAIDYVRGNNLVTVPGIASESMHMTMMSAQAQLSNPFFLGGSLIQVAYPTDGMDYEAREEAMRGNNLAFAHATAFHEMIPGHNLSFYDNARYRGYRASLGLDTPFYTEGWALYWELTLYDKGFDTTPEQRVGALFWRMHRCARIIFSLKFHMGEWSPQQAIDFLVDKVGHERDNATAEVRRSFQGGYSPLYQAAYLLGGLELRGLRHELVDSKTMSEQAFHDEILRQGSMPIALIRLALTKQHLTRDMPIDWKFYGDLPDH